MGNLERIGVHVLLRPTVQPSESEQAFRLRRRVNIAAVLAVSPGGDHSLDRWPKAQQLALANRVEAWFQKTLISGK